MFENGKPDECLLFMRQFNRTLAASGTLEMVVKVQYLRTLVCGEVLHQFDLLSNNAEITETLNEEYIIKGLALKVSTVNSIFFKHNATRNEETTRSKSKTLYGALD